MMATVFSQNIKHSAFKTKKKKKINVAVLVKMHH